MISRADAQSFDRVAAEYDRLGELARVDHVGRWLDDVLPPAGGCALDLGCGSGRHAVLLAERFGQVEAVDVSEPMIKLARRRRARPNISYRRADLHQVAGTGGYDFILSVLALHHVPDLHAALAHIRTLLAPDGRVVLMDMYEAGPVPLPRRVLQRIVPLRVRLHGLAAQALVQDLVRRGPAVAWEVYRLSTGPWLDHRVSDRFFTRNELQRACLEVFPGCELRTCGGPRAIAVIWDAAAAMG
ncbi:MAG TPA: class I SAM-dependent methyltransferase [Trebonia sp.]